MKIKRIEVENFGCLEHAEVPLADQGMVFVMGENLDTESSNSNGSGKTTLFKAVTWGLFGQTVDGDKADEVIRKGTSEAVVRVELEDFTIRRSRKKGSPKLEILGSTGEPIEGTKDDLQAKIIEWVGLDFQAFKNTVLYGQGDILRFAHPATTDSQRKDILHQVLRTERFKRAHEEVRERKNRTVKKLEGVQAEIGKLKARMEEHDLDDLKAKSDRWEANWEASLQVTTRRVEELIERAKTKKTEAGEALSMLRRKVAMLKKSIEGAKDPSVEAKAIRDKLKAAVQDKESLGVILAEIMADAKTIKRHLVGLDGDKCPTCGSSLAEGEAAKHVGGLKANLSSLSGKEEVTRLAMEEVVERIARIEETLDNELAKVKRFEESRRELAEANGKLAASEGVETIVKELKSQAVREMAKLEELKSQVNPFDETIAAAVAKMSEHRDALKGLRVTEEELSVDLAHLEFWVKGFSSQGLPSYVLDSIMPFLTDRANHYLGILADGDIIMGFRTQRELKSRAGVKDEIEIIWTIEGAEGVTPSGGQRKRMELATDLALMDLVATREGGHLDLLLLDEVLDGLDREGRTRVLTLLQELRRERGSIFVVSHEPDLAEVFERSIKVVKSGGASRIES